MWRGPLAYGQATEDRTVLIEAESTECVRAVQDRRYEPTDIPVTSARPRGLTPQLSPERAPVPTGLGSTATCSVARWLGGSASTGSVARWLGRPVARGRGGSVARSGSPGPGARESGGEGKRGEGWTGGGRAV